MKFKLAVFYGILIWIITFLASNVITPFFTDYLPGINIVEPILLIIVIGFFGILYIRNINSNEVVEGFFAGVIFIIIDVIFDFAFLILPHTKNLIFKDYPLHLTFMIIFTLLITTFLGYLAQMTIDLK